VKTIVISDTHLDKKFDKRKFNFLKRTILSADKIIINGDFWDSWFVTIDDFLISKWQDIFPLLLDKDTFYIYGNHDPQQLVKNNWKYFATAAGEYYDYHDGGTSVHICHGDSFLLGKRGKIFEIYAQFVAMTNNSLAAKILSRFMHLVEYLGYKIFGKKFMTQNKISKKNNYLQKISRNPQSNEWLICGDTHHAELDNFFLHANSGCIHYGQGSFVQIENGQVSLVKIDY